MPVGVGVAVPVGVAVGVGVSVPVGVWVGVFDGVAVVVVGVPDGVLVGVLLGVFVLVGVLVAVLVEGEPTVIVPEPMVAVIVPPDCRRGPPPGAAERTTFTVPFAIAWKVTVKSGQATPAVHTVPPPK